MSPSPIEYVRHMLDEAAYLESASEGMEYASFVDDETAKRAFVRSFEIIGEAAKKLPAGWRERYPNLPWKEMTGMRDRLIHGYFGVNYDTVWGTVRNGVPELRAALEKLLEEETGPASLENT